MSQMPMPRWPLPQMPPGYGEGTGSNNRDSSDWAQRHPEDPMLNPQQPEAPWWERGTFPTPPNGPIRWNPGERITTPPMYAPEGEYSLTGGPYRGPNPNAIPISNQPGGGMYPYGFASPNVQQKLSGTIGGMVHPKRTMRMSGGGVGIQGPPKPPEPPPIAQPPGWNWQDNIQTAAPPMFGSGYARKV